MPRTLLFDLDGTLTDPEEGITGCIAHALRALCFEVPCSQDLRECIGPPLAGSLKRLLRTDDELLIAKALSFYRDRFSEVGLYENSVYDGIPEALNELQESGYDLFVATSKPHVYAERIIAHFGLERFFKKVYGSDLDGARSDKGELISHVMEVERLDGGRTVMIGDRVHDVLGAARAGIPCIGVLYGYGSSDELGGAVSLCDTPSGLPQAVRLTSNREFEAD